MAAPKRDLFKAAEVCEVANVQPYVLRSWEAEFPQLGQAPTGGGPRVYRRSDIELVLRIKSMVFGEGLTLAGARRRLEETAAEPVDMAGLLDEVNAGLGDETRATVRQVRDGLRGLLAMLSDERRPDLVLEAPTASPRRTGRPKRGREAAASVE